MIEQTTNGILVVGHGSRRSEANQDVRKATELIGRKGGFPLVEAAFLEIELPDIRSGFKRLVERGARAITVHPYFLSPGRHTRGDLPKRVAEASALHPGVEYRITEPLSSHRFVVEASIERITETIATEKKNKAYRKRRHLSESEKGKVYIVGAGPGDPGLLTIRARDLLRSSDVVLYDYLVNPEILELIPAEADLFYVGKIGGAEQTPQERINQLMIGSARAGKSVVRLKGGDPFVFGRGGEEAEALSDAGVPFEIVPGISSALAAAAYAGIPVTHRGISASLSVVTGVQLREGSMHPEGQQMQIGGADTLVILMGISNIRSIAAQLITAGRAPDTPVAAIQWATYEHQSTVVGTLETIADEIEIAGLQAPAVVVVGEVVELRDKLKWFAADVPAVAGISGISNQFSVL